MPDDHYRAGGMATSLRPGCTGLPVFYWPAISLQTARWPHRSRIQRWHRTNRSMTIYVIAGPPGIGKSTNANELIPVGVPIIDQDLAGYQYKKQGFTDYQDLASIRSNQQLKDYLFSGQDFALELNLGFASHYDYLKSIAFFDRRNQINLLLFFTDDINLCLDRAAVWYLSGGHEVKPEVIEEMYTNTLPLFAENRTLFQSVRLIDMTGITVTEYGRRSDGLPHWITSNGLTDYLLK